VGAGKAARYTMMRDGVSRLKAEELKYMSGGGLWYIGALFVKKGGVAVGDIKCPQTPIYIT